MSQNEFHEDMEARIYRVDSPEGSRLQIEADEQSFTSWPNADVETFIEQAARSEENEARSIHRSNRYQGALLVLMGNALTYSGITEYSKTDNSLYLVGGLLGGIAGIGFGIRLPRMRTTLETQAAYRRTAEIIRNMPRRVHRR